MGPLQNNGGAAAVKFIIDNTFPRWDFYFFPDQENKWDVGLKENTAYISDKKTYELSPPNGPLSPRSPLFS
ncbi:hypothetical protein GMLC_23550 [Geomonas limicola]|uniref:Uncharacterized protein n=1 Tax=Geomonas limicola TaxID=2740186 RepID=A0A6V8N876_9BACT|nr:hypothetical protein GMLC_23550 [Geomonas limicola]